MNIDEKTAYIIHHLTEGDDPKDIVFDLCQRTNMNWAQAEAVVKQVQEEKEGVIARKQFPLLFVLALAIFMAGLGLVGYSLYLFALPLIEGNSGTPVAVVNYSTYILQVILGSRGAVIYALIIGTGMILGSLFGMRDVWTKILSK